MQIGWILRIFWDTINNCPKRFVHRQRFLSEDGHTCSIWWDGSSPFKQQKLANEPFNIILISPGMYDNWQTGYMKQCLDAFKRYQTHHSKSKFYVGVFHKPFVVDDVTADHVPNYTEPQHLLEAVTFLNGSFPQAKILLFGCSAGGNLSIRAGQEGLSSNRIVAVASVCSPLDLHWQRFKMEKNMIHWVFRRALWVAMLFRVVMRVALRYPWKWFRVFLKFLFCYDYRMVSQIVETFIWKENPISLCDKESVIQHVTASGSPKKSLKTMIVYALDDPLVTPPPCLDENVLRIGLSQGGHLGFESWQWDFIVERWMYQISQEAEGIVA
jgi:predicted alpha/beta-fold hydrolase